MRMQLTPGPEAHFVFQTPRSKESPSPSRAIFEMAVLSLLIAIAAGCTSRAGMPAPPAPPKVTVAPVEQRELVEWDEFTGRTEAVEFVEVRPRVSGHIQTV